MGLFKILTTEGLQDSEDRIGGFQRLDTDVYAGMIKVAYAITSEGGAQGVVLNIDFEGKEYSETIYVTDKKGQNYFLNKDDNTKKVQLPGFIIIDELCLVTTDKPLSEQDTEEKVVKVYDKDAKKELPKGVPVLTELTGKPVLLGVLKTLENQNEKSGSEYVPTAKTREVNSIDKVFHPTLRITVVEARNTKEGEQPEAKFIESWTTRNKGNTRDKRTIKDGDDGVKSGRPGGTAPKSGEGARKSLFG